MKLFKRKYHTLKIFSREKRTSQEKIILTEDHKFWNHKDLIPQLLDREEPFTQRRQHLVLIETFLINLGLLEDNQVMDLLK
jgi:hypothetical protein